MRLTDRLDALELFGKATGLLNVKEQPVSPLEAFGADVLLTMREELRTGALRPGKGSTIREQLMTATDRVRKHRAKLRTEHYSRLDVWIATWIVDGIRQLAKTRGRATWEEVQDVLEQHLIADGAAAGGQPATSKNRPAESRDR